MSSSIFDGIKHNKQFEKICKMRQKELKNYLKQKLNMQSGDGWLYKEGTFPVLLTAHMDTVHTKQCKNIIYQRDKLSGNSMITSPEGIGGDDRCGIYMILKILEKVDCSVLFCEDEEIGSVGAGKFITTDLCESLKGKFKYIIELDRAYDHDAVFYDDDNQDFHDFIVNGKEFWKEAHGSWSDICTLSPALDISSVNFSCGYYKAHTTNEYVILEEMERSIEEVIKVLQRTDVNAKAFEFIERKYANYYGYGLCSGGYGYSWYDKYDVYGDDYFESYSDKKKTNTQSYLEVYLTDGTYLQTYGEDVNECFMSIFLSYPEVRFGDISDFNYWEE